MISTTANDRWWYNAQMESKTYTWVGAAVGSMAGGMIPNLWGAGLFSFSGIIFSSLGAIFGIWIVFKLSHY